MEAQPRPATGRELDPVLLHVGYHRTGTTWLQTSLLGDRAAGFASPLNKSADVFPMLIAPHSLDFDPAVCRELMYPRLLDAQDEGLIPVVSSERLVGSPNFGGRDSKELADRVAAVFPHARVLVGIREQRGMLLSSYKSYVNAGGSGSVADYLEPPLHGGGVPRFDLAHFEYDRLVGYYGRLFAPDRVMVAPLERVVHDPASVTREIAALCGMDPERTSAGADSLAGKRNAGLSGVATAVKRPLNPIFARDRLNPRPLVPVRDGDRRLRRLSRYVASRAPRSWNKAADARLMDEIVSIVDGRYVASNQRLRETTGVPLERFGYQL